METQAPAAPLLTTTRLAFHAELLAHGVLSFNDTGKPNIADGDNKTSVWLAAHILTRLKAETAQFVLAAQTGGLLLEEAVSAYLNDTLPRLGLLGSEGLVAQRRRRISDFQQYAHLRVLERLAAESREVRFALGGDYVVVPDVVVARDALSEEVLTGELGLADTSTAQRSTLRAAQHPLLHASISCKQTIRSDRSQNSRLEALNLLRNRRGRAPHIAVVTAEPLPSRIASVAAGTGDFDCVYHIALPELAEGMDLLCGLSGGTRERSARRAQKEQLDLMTETGRLKDISDLPLDLLL